MLYVKQNDGKWSCDNIKPKTRYVLLQSQIDNIWITKFPAIKTKEAIALIERAINDKLTGKAMGYRLTEIEYSPKPMSEETKLALREKKKAKKEMAKESDG